MTYLTIFLIGYIGFLPFHIINSVIGGGLGGMVIVILLLSTTGAGNAALH